MEIIIDLFGWMGEVLTAFAEMRSNDGIFSWIMGNAILIMILFTLGTAWAASTKEDWDNKFMQAIRKALFLAAPDLKLPDEPITDEREVKDEQIT